MSLFFSFPILTIMYNCHFTLKEQIHQVWIREGSGSVSADKLWGDGLYFRWRLEFIQWGKYSTVASGGLKPLCASHVLPLHSNHRAELRIRFFFFLNNSKSSITLRVLLKVFHRICLRHAKKKFYLFTKLRLFFIIQSKMVVRNITFLKWYNMNHNFNFTISYNLI